MGQVKLKVSGMTCGHCVQAVTGALEGVEGVRQAKVDLEQSRAVVEYDETLTSPDALVVAVAAEGYTAAPAG